MGSFANTLFSILLGWLQGLISMIWSAMSAKDGESFFQYIGNNWIKIALVLCIAGLIADFAVYFFRWAPYKVWQTFWRHLKGEKKEKDSAGMSRAEAEPVFAFQDNGKKNSDPVRRRRTPELRNRDHDEPDELSRWKTEEPDELSRWRAEEPETEASAVPAEITKAGYTVPADSPYRKPGDRNRRRRLRINLLGDAEEDNGIHYYSPRPMMDQKEAYHAPVYPEKWEGSRDQNS